MNYETNSTQETFNIGKKIAKEAKLGQVYTLSGDLGVGKTVFSKGFAEGLGIEEVVNSPTFTIMNIYESGRIPLYHFDVYRLEDESEIEEVGYDDYFNSDGVCLIEWAEMISDYLPKDVIKITISKDLSKGFDYRNISVEYND